ncbi:MAG: SGNH/GDSL hydrolase family protein [Acidobacteria bacterium]|nr:SGNH/GDSL hydrolase family protein [Acidobacteriota bacterium]
MFDPLRQPFLKFVSVAVIAALGGTLIASLTISEAQGDYRHWIGTWAAAPQRPIKGSARTFHNQSLRLIVHSSAGGKTLRVRISNIFGDQPLVIGSAHIARRTAGASIDAASDRILTFDKKRAITIPAGSLAVSDPVDLDFPALSDLAISFFLPDSTPVTTVHILAQQTNYISAQTGDSTGAADFPATETMDFWPFLTGVDVMVRGREGATIIAFGSSLTDGDGSTEDANRRWPDVLAERLQKSGYADLGILNEGIIGNRLLNDAADPGQSGGPRPLGPLFDELGTALGDAGVKRFDRDVLAQAGVKYVILALGVNDILFPGSWIPSRERVNAESLIRGNRQLILRAHRHGIRAIGATIPPFEHALWQRPFFDHFYTPENERIRQQVNAWIRSSGEFDGLIDFDEAVRDPKRPAQIRPEYDSGDHLHPNDSGNTAQGAIIALSLFRLTR